MSRIKHQLLHLSLPRKLALGGSALLLFTLFMPWHRIGDTAASGLQESNRITGMFLLMFALVALASIVLPILGLRMPGIQSRTAAILTFCGFQSGFLALVLILTHQTTATHSVSIGLYLALIASFILFAGGYLLIGTAQAADTHGHLAPLTTTPPASHTENIHRPERTPHAEDATREIREDMRMKMDI